eukprot:TRINITY_DN33227_c0_g1_i1.p1 TRINITY_DN33227_c0_g1~~TRINITY_DN33227_c0_g1_i1.p1  ORF type:complete len:324 (+),score=67.34 TRINITY_DN33227_c0_g1_i1:36-974(+)
MATSNHGSSASSPKMAARSRSGELSAAPSPTLRRAVEAARTSLAAGGMLAGLGLQRATEVRALAASALSECEDAQPFCARVTVVDGESDVPVMPKPSVNGACVGHLRPGDVAEVIARAVIQRDGRVYLRLRDVAGWVSTRARDNLGRVVLAFAGADASTGAGTEDATLEPPGGGITVASRALPVLAGTCARARRFQALSACPLLQGDPSAPGGLTTTASRLAAREEFLADAAVLRPAEGRAYLRLQDGRGWVCERSRSDFGSLVVEPLPETEAAANGALVAVPNGSLPAKRRRLTIDWIGKVARCRGDDGNA